MSTLVAALAGQWAVSGTVLDFPEWIETEYPATAAAIYAAEGGRELVYGWSRAAAKR